VIIIAPTPRLVENQLEVAFIVKNEQGMLVNGTGVYRSVLENQQQLLETVSRIFEKCINICRNINVRSFSAQYE